MLKLPAIAALFAVAITFISIAMARLHPSHTHPDRGAYTMGSCISNYGFTLGGFVCLIFFGETALAMQTVYIFPLVVFIYLVWFPIARYYGDGGEKVTPLRSFLMAFTDITTLPLAGTVVGLALKYFSQDYTFLARPAFLEYVNKTLVWTGTAASMFTIGITLNLSSVGKYLKENVSVSVTKFLLGPLAGYALAKLFHADPMQVKVTVILTSVPVGLFASFASSIFGLNRNLANSLFVVNTGAYLVIILPILAILMPYIN